MIGTDLVEHKDIMSLDNRFIKRVLSEYEYNVYITLNSKKRQIEYIASRFACKEAIFKAYKHLDIHLDYKDVSIKNDEYGCPYAVCSKFEMKIDISLTHTDNYSQAVAILL